MPRRAAYRFDEGDGKKNQGDFRRRALERSNQVKERPDLFTELVEFLAPRPGLLPAISAVDAKDYADKWTQKYVSGLVRRASSRTGEPPKTIADAIVDTIAETTFQYAKIPPSGVRLVREAHRFSMGIENIVGSLLEEYIYSVSSELGWICAWGSTVRAVDFIHPGDGRLLQIKNRSNSENSSSSAIRLDTTIEKWHRVDASNGETQWDKLNKLCGTESFSEDEFGRFVRESMRENPRLVHTSEIFVYELATACASLQSLQNTKPTQ